MSTERGHRIVITIPSRLWSRVNEEKARTGKSVSAICRESLIKKFTVEDV